MGPSTMMKLACALLLLVAAVSCAPTTPDTLVAEDSKFVPGYGMPSVSMPWGPPIDWGAIADTIAKQLDDYYEIEIDLSHIRLQVRYCSQRGRAALALHEQRQSPFV